MARTTATEVKQNSGVYQITNLINRSISPETRQKLSIAAKNQWARCKASV